MKKFYGHETYVQSVGVYNDLEIDGFSIAVCAEMASNYNDIAHVLLMRWSSLAMISALSI